jgi:hypothetical protein
MEMYSVIGLGLTTIFVLRPMIMGVTRNKGRRRRRR